MVVVGVVVQSKSLETGLSPRPASQREIQASVVSATEVMVGDVQPIKLPDGVPMLPARGLGRYRFDEI